MKLLDVTMDDGKKCAQLLNLLKAGTWQLAGPDIAAHAETVLWVHRLAQSLAEQLKGVKPVTAPVSSPATSGMKIKNMGPLGNTQKPKKRK